MKPNLIIFIDDEQDQLVYKRAAVERRFAAGSTPCQTICIGTVGEALEYFDAFHDEVLAVIIDIRMAPGEDFPQESGNYDNVGLLLFERIDDMQARFNRQRMGAPIAMSFFTQYDDAKTLKAVEDLYIELRPAEVSSLAPFARILWSKQTDHDEFATALLEWLTARQQLYGLPGSWNPGTGLSS